MERGVLVAHQPAYLPWPGFFSRLLDVDELVLLDHVQFSERGWQNRNFVRGPVGTEPIRLTVPVRHRFGQAIRDVETAHSDWARRHWRTLVHSYGRAPYWPNYRGRLEEIFCRQWERLAPLNEALLELLLDGLGLRVCLVRSSALAPGGRQTHMLMNLCRAQGANRLRVGTGALAYLDHDQLAEHGIAVEIATYSHPRYGSAPGWAPGLSALDLLLHEGPNAKAILRAGARTETKALT
ncbi:hypothetical protein T261_0744 [Streptomyces lydicus]|nr:hypothetical protein T261_0744 [Streptomyces lydicus]